MMNQLCYYPTTVAIIDDSESFLAMIDKKMGKNQPRRLYSNPSLALQEINAAAKSGRQLENVLKNVPVEKVEEMDVKLNADVIIDIDFNKLCLEAYNAERFGQVSTVLVDYSMPDMDGIEFCRNLKDKMIEKIMITAVADYKLAAQAFNEKIIDGFILKDAPHLFEDINSSITVAQDNYFKNIYGVDGILGCLFRNQLPCDNRNYSKFLESISAQINFIEYYTLDKAGSILFLNEAAEQTYLMVKSNNDLDDLYAIAKDNGASKAILGALRDKKAAPVLISENDYAASVNDWKMYPLQVIPSKEGYFYSLISGNSIDMLDLKRTVSFQQYKAQNAQYFAK